MEWVRVHIIWVYLIVLTGCSTHYFLEGSALDSQGAYMEAAELYEKAAKGKLKVEDERREQRNLCSGLGAACVKL